MKRVFVLTLLGLGACSSGTNGSVDAGIIDGGRPLGWDGGVVNCAPASAACSGAACLRLNEAAAKNEGIWLDEELETEDFVELVNAGDMPIELGDFFIGDEPDQTHRLAGGQLGPGERRLLWLDKDLDQGPLHHDFKLSSSGEPLMLWHVQKGLVDCWELPALAPNQVMARFPDALGAPGLCSFASPDAPNPGSCSPPPPAVVPPDYVYAEFTWPDPWPQAGSSPRLNELALRQDQPFIEIWSGQSRSLDGLRVELAAMQPGESYPEVGGGYPLQLSGEIEAGEMRVFAVGPEAMSALDASPDFEGVVSLFNAEGELLDRVDFMHWPDDAVLARQGDGAATWHLCYGSSANQSNSTCEPLASRALGERAHRLLTPADFETLSTGGRALGIQAVKSVIDRQAGGVVHLLSSARFDLHYTFVRRLIEAQVELDRCDPEEAAVFRAGWRQFSADQYEAVDSRRYYLSTLVRSSSNALHTLEFVTGDQVSTAQISEAFWLLMRRMLKPDLWHLRPQSSGQHDKVLALQGSLPIVAENAPFVGMQEQPLNAAVSFGLLRFIAYHELASATLGAQIIVLTDEVPNELALSAGLITESFQTPLAHVNLLAKNRGTPNLALRDARNDPRVAPFLDQLIRFEVHSGGFSIRLASAEEAQDHEAQRLAEQEVLRPRRDLDLRGVQPLGHHGLEALPGLGAKAAHLAQLEQFRLTRSSCAGAVNTPADAFALPLVHSVEHFSASGAQGLLQELLSDPLFQSHPQRRAEGLERVQQLILQQPVEPALLASLTEGIRSRYGQARTRLRSSSNTEDLPGFNGAGLYRSVSVEVGNEERSVADGLRQVWASLWSARAFDERSWFKVDQSLLGMGVLVHAAYRSEKANGVGISRSILNPNRGDIHSMIVQAGEASVTNPAPGVQAESFIFRFGRSPEVVYQRRSSLTRGAPVLQTVELRQAICTLAGIHSAFRPLLDPDNANRYFAMDIEFKLVGPERQLLVKQARPFSFGALEPVGDCREF
jgi:hypothetical protein